MFVPMIAEELKHIELSNVQTEDGTIDRLVLNTKFPTVKEVVFRLTNTELYLEFPHFSMDLDADITDVSGGKTKAKVALKDMSTFLKYKYVTDDSGDVDLDITINQLTLSSHSRVNQKAIDSSLSVGMSVFEQGLKQSTRRSLSEITNFLQQAGRKNRRLADTNATNGVTWQQQP